MISQEEFDQLQEEILERAFCLMFQDIYLTVDEAYQMVVEEVTTEQGIPLRTFRDPISGDLYIAIGEGEPEE